MTLYPGWRLGWPKAKKPKPAYFLDDDSGEVEGAAEDVARHIQDQICDDYVNGRWGLVFDENRLEVPVRITVELVEGET